MTAAPLTVTGVTASNKDYDGTTAATLELAAANWWASSAAIP